MVNVSALDLGTGKSQAIRLTASSGLDKGQIEKLVQEAEENAEEDRVRREFTDLHNKADGLVYSTERTLEEFAGSIGDDERGPIQAQIAVTRDAMDGEDLGALRAAVDELSALTYMMTENLYAELAGVL